MTDPIRINVQGYGAIELECPPGVDIEVAADLVGLAVAQIMQLVDPATQAKRFHPALGFPARGGGGDDESTWQATASSIQAR